MSLYKNKKVVVTGGSGFVGTHFIQELLDRGANVRTSIHKTPQSTVTKLVTTQDVF